MAAAGHPRKTPDAALVADQLEGQRPNNRVSPVYRQVDVGGPGEHRMQTVAINRNESTLMRLHASGQIDARLFQAAMSLRDLLERSMLHSLKAQDMLADHRSTPGSRAPSESAEHCAAEYRAAIKQLCQPRLGFHPTKHGVIVMPGHVIVALIEQHQTIREIEDRFSMPHGTGARRIRACLNLLDEHFEGTLQG